MERGKIMITKNYIKMCEQAEKIQKLWKPKEGDYFYGYEWSDKAWSDGDIETENISELATKEIHLLYFSGDDFNSCFPMGEEIGQGKNKPDLTKSFWLPTQEQLCEMAFPSNDRGFVMKLAEIYNWLHKENRKDKRAYRWLKSWNELWLAFVMKEKYQKKWLPKEQKWSQSEDCLDSR